MDPIREQIDVMTRRHFFGRTGVSLGSAALAGLLADRASAADLDRAKPVSGGLPTMRVPPRMASPSAVSACVSPLCGISIWRVTGAA